MKDCQYANAQVVKTCYSIVNELLLLWVVNTFEETCLLRCPAEKTRRARHWARTLWVAQGLYTFIIRPCSVIKREFAETASPVHLSAKLLHTKYTKEQENEEHEQYCITQDWQRTQQRLDELLHPRNRVDASQRSENSEHSQGSYLADLGAQYNLDQAGYYNQEVQPIPSIPQVGIPVVNEAHGCDPNQTLNSKDQTEYDLNLLQSLIALSKILQISVVVGDQHDRVDYDAQDDKVLKHGVVSYLDESLAH